MVWWVLGVLMVLGLSRAYNPGTSWRNPQYMAYIYGTGSGAVYLSSTLEPLTSPKAVYSNDVTMFALQTDGTLENVDSVNTNTDDVK